MPAPYQLVSITDEPVASSSVDIDDVGAIADISIQLSAAEQVTLFSVDVNDVATAIWRLEAPLGGLDKSWPHPLKVVGGTLRITAGGAATITHYSIQKSSRGTKRYALGGHVA